MISMKTVWLLLLCAPASALTPQVVLADSDHELARELKQAGDILPLEQILDKVQQLHPGHVLEVELEKKQQHYIYEIETVDTKGNVWEMQFNAKTGELLKSKKEK